MRGFKVTNRDMQCTNFQFELGVEFSVDGEIKACKNGFHFCKKLSDCFNYYRFNSENRVFEIEGSGDFDKEGDKTAVRTIKFIRELSWMDVLSLVNTGKNNTGRDNSGDYNSGRNNSGNLNSGSYNSGHDNTGDCNSGHDNTGHGNSGDFNSGQYNSGNHNSGDLDSGSRNSGSRNSGSYNSGHGNSGHRNSGDRNSGDRNSGNYNSGYHNSGYRNSGHYNSGDYNSGNYNSTNYSTGYFNSEEQTVFMFNKDTGLKRNEIDLPYIDLKLNKWITSSKMTEIEKKENPTWETLGGYLKQIPYKEAWKKAWVELNKEDKQKFLDLPNFDANIFEEITGVKIN